MNLPLKKIFTSWKVILLVFFVVSSFITIQPQIFGNEGVMIKNVAVNSSAANAGMENPSPKLTLLNREKVISINNEAVNTFEDYHGQLMTLRVDQTVRIETNEGFYNLETKANEEGIIDLGLQVISAPTSNLKKGLDLEGGTRALLQPAEPVSQEDLEITIDNLKERLNVYGLSDIVVRAASDLAGNDFILVEIAGVTAKEVQELLAREGKFEAKIGNETVFFGEDKDIAYVCKSADCSGINPRTGCSRSGDGYGCGFFFTITLSPDAAERQAELTKNLAVTDGYLSEELVLYLDDKEVDRLKISASLKGIPTTDIQITGSGVGRTQEEAMMNSLDNMKQLRTFLITGSLPVKLEIVKMDTISPSLGQEFLNNIILVATLAILAVVTIVFIRYRKIKIALPMILTIISEIVMILGFAALVGWNLDLAAIAGIIIVAGTGVDHLIIITDETVRGEVITSWKKRIKNAMFIVMGAYVTTVAGMIPLWFAGAGLLKGFAFTTIAGVSFGVLVARPAYAVIIEKLLKE